MDKSKLAKIRKKTYERHREKTLERVRQYRDDNKDTINEKRRLKYERNRDVILARQRARYNDRQTENPPGRRLDVGSRTFEVRQRKARWNLIQMNGYLRSETRTESMHKHELERIELEPRPTPNGRIGLDINMDCEYTTMLFKLPCYYCALEAIGELDEINDNAEYADGKYITRCKVCNTVKYEDVVEQEG